MKFFFSSEKTLTSFSVILEAKSWKSSRIFFHYSFMFFLFLVFFFFFSSFFSFFVFFFIFFHFFIFSVFFIFFFFLSFFHFSSFLFHFLIFFCHFFHYSFIFFHFFHVLSFLFLFFFFFFSFLFLFLFLFVGCSKSDFVLGLNFVTISLDSSLQRINFSARLLGTTSLYGLFSFFSSLLFFLLFFSFSFSLKKLFSLIFFSVMCVRVLQKMFPPLSVLHGDVVSLRHGAG